MNCAYCREHLNDKATVCNSCGRKQPASEETIRRRVAFGFKLLAGAGVVGLLIWFEWNIDQRALAVDDARIAARFCGDSSVNGAFAEQTVQRLHDEGASWRDAAKQFRVLIGCSPSGQ